MPDDSAANFAETLSTRFGSTPVRVGREWRCWCPVHEADGAAGHHSPSLAIWNRPDGSAAYHCLTGCPHAAIRAALAVRGLGRLARAGAQQRVDAAKAETRAQVASRRRAEALHLRAHHIEDDSAVGRYLWSRRLWLTEDEHAWLGECHSSDKRGDRLLLGVVVDPATLTDACVVATGMASLAIKADGTPRIVSGGKKLRLVHGQRRGGAVPLGAPGPRVVVGEGIETTLSAMRLLEISFGLAVLGVGNLAPLMMPACVEQAIIACDNDPAGIAGAEIAATKWRTKGYPVTIACWGEANVKWDANDELNWRVNNDTA